MKKEPEEFYCTPCLKCHGQGKLKRKVRKKERLNHSTEIKNTENHLYSCPKCSGSGLIQTDKKPIPNKENYPHVAIIGAGIGGVALAVACLHRGIPFTLYERDGSFDARSQGYGLTLQQASKSLKGFGISSLKESIISTKHMVHNTKGDIIGAWGMRKWVTEDAKKPVKHTNIHVARQSLRLALLEQLGGDSMVKWNHQLIDFENNDDDSVNLKFQVNNEVKLAKADLIVGADGIRSKVRELIVEETMSPLRYLDCIVILGICSLKTIKEKNHALLDGETVFQTANGYERIYVMPFTKDSVMWQLSFPIPENEAKILSAKGQKALKEEASKRTQWHAPIPEIIASTPETLISGYPVYDRDLLKPNMLEAVGPVTLIGDAAHPMSPFKGQGANQALLDALALAREISKSCRTFSHWKDIGIRKSALTAFELEMLKRSAIKVKDSAKVAELLHSEAVLHKSDKPRGSYFK